MKASAEENWFLFHRMKKNLGHPSEVWSWSCSWRRASPGAHDFFLAAASLGGPGTIACTGLLASNSMRNRRCWAIISYLWFQEFVGLLISKCARRLVMGFLLQGKVGMVRGFDRSLPLWRRDCVVVTCSLAWVTGHSNTDTSQLHCPASKHQPCSLYRASIRYSWRSEVPVQLELFPLY